MIRFKFFGILAILSGFAVNAQTNVTLDGALPYSTSLNDVWGYEDDNGTEYALVGVRNGFSVVELSDPSHPTEVFFISGSPSTWRDIKTWDHYAYVMHDNPSGMNPSNGLLIVDLDSMNVNDPTYKFMYPQYVVNGNVVDSATESHNLWIDENGYLYIFGADVGLGGALIMDVATDPWNPAFVGIYNSAYLHDGYVRGDTLWGAGLTQGILVSDVSNKAQPQFLTQFNTPSIFAHNCWLSDDGKTLFTTDEVGSGYIASYDVSNLSNVSELDRFRVTPNENTIPHNAHVYGDFLVTSYYTYGLQILDIKDPAWMIEVGQYDSSPLSGGGFDGAWGAFPFFNSGHCLITDIQEGLFITTPSYTAASRIYASVVDSVTGAPIPNATVYLVADMDTVSLDANAEFKRGKVGNFQEAIMIDATGYKDLIEPFTYREGMMDTLVFKLLPNDFNVGEGSLEGLTIFPNPNSGEFTLRSEQLMSNATVSITDLSGRVVMMKDWQSSDAELNINLELPQGVYVVEVNLGGNIWHERVVVQ